MSERELPDNVVSIAPRLPDGRRGFRISEIADALGVSLSVPYDAYYRGEFGEVWRFGRAIVVPAESVESWLASKRSA